MCMITVVCTLARLYVGIIHLGYHEETILIHSHEKKALKKNKQQGDVSAMASIRSTFSPSYERQ